MLRHGRTPASPDEPVAVPDLFDKYLNFVGECFLFILRKRNDEFVRIPRFCVEVVRAEKNPAGLFAVAPVQDEGDFRRCNRFVGKVVQRHLSPCAFFVSNT